MLISDGNKTRQMDQIDQNTDEFSNLLIKKIEQLHAALSCAAQDNLKLRQQLAEQERIQRKEKA